jgi:phage tail sheath protein FI
MPILPTYPGVYVEELPSGVHNIVGVSTASTAFVDFFTQGPMGIPTLVNNFTQFQTMFGGLDERSEASYGILQYFLNGGQTAWIVRVAAGSPEPSSVTLEDKASKGTLTVTASSAGLWGNNLQVGIDYNTTSPTTTFNLVVRLVDSASKPTQVLNSEIYRNLSMSSSSANFAVGVVNAASALIQLKSLGTGTSPVTTGTDVIGPIANPTSTAYTAVSNTTTPANDGTIPDATALKNGIATLDHLDPYIFNILCVPAAATLVAAGAPDSTNIAGVYSDAASFCDTHRAMLIVDIPSTIDSTSSTAATGVLNWLSTLQTKGFEPDANSAIYFPTLQVSDPLNGGRLRNVGASGTLAGIWASTDASRGVWKSPAGIDATVSGASLAYIMNDSDSAAINPMGINGLRNFKTYGNVVWGARTMQGADQLASQWAYIAVRRTALYIEESLLEGLKWVVFEPNDTPLWSQIRLNVTSFMQNLFRQGAFQGSSAASAYFVKCDSETTTQTDINSGIVNIVVGFAPLKPAEFVILQIQQMAGQAGS